MLSEVKLYWVIYEQTSNARDRQQTENALSSWRHEWADLFGKSSLRALDAVHSWSS